MPTLVVLAENVLRAEGYVWRYSISVAGEQIATAVSEPMALESLEVSELHLPHAQGRFRLRQAREMAELYAARQRGETIRNNPNVYPTTADGHDMVLTEGWTRRSGKPYATCSCGEWEYDGHVRTGRDTAPSARLSIATNMHSKHSKLVLSGHHAEFVAAGLI
jgi:hypothetical protein